MNQICVDQDQACHDNKAERKCKALKKVNNHILHKVYFKRYASYKFDQLVYSLINRNKAVLFSSLINRSARRSTNVTTTIGSAT